LILAGIGISKIPGKGEHPVLIGLAVVTVFISLFNGLVLAHSYSTYSQPKTTNTLYFK